MVSSSPSIACIAVMSFMVLMATTPSSDFILKDLNKDICSNTKVLSRSFCLKFLGSNPVEVKSLLLSLAEATMDVASSKATKTSQLMIKWQNETDNPQLKNAISLCPRPYSEAITDLKEAIEKVRSGDYVALQRAVVDASIQFHACEEKFEDTPPDPSPLCSTSGELAAISSILRAVSKFLVKSYKGFCNICIGE